MPANEILTTNYRSNINWLDELTNIYKSPNRKLMLKELYEKNLKCHVKEWNPNEIFYAYRTNDGDVSTYEKYTKMYQKYVKENNIKNYYVKCIKNCDANGIESTGINSVYFNGVIYNSEDLGDILNVKSKRRHKNSDGELEYSFRSCFEITNIYSIYCTQGQTVTNLNLIPDDEKYYYSNIEMYYVLASRLQKLS